MAKANRLPGIPPRIETTPVRTAPVALNEAMTTFLKRLANADPERWGNFSHVIREALARTFPIPATQEEEDALIDAIRHGLKEWAIPPTVAYGVAPNAFQYAQASQNPGFPLQSSPILAYQGQVVMPQEPFPGYGGPVSDGLNYPVANPIATAMANGIPLETVSDDKSDVKDNDDEPGFKPSKVGKLYVPMNWLYYETLDAANDMEMTFTRKSSGIETKLEYQGEIIDSWHLQTSVFPTNSIEEVKATAKQRAQFLQKENEKFQEMDIEIHYRDMVQAVFLRIAGFATEFLPQETQQ